MGTEILTLVPKTERVTAVVYDGTNFDAVYEFTGGHFMQTPADDDAPERCQVYVAGSWVPVDPGTAIIKRAIGNLDVLPADQIELHYDTYVAEPEPEVDPAVLVEPPKGRHTRKAE